MSNLARSVWLVALAKLVIHLATSAQGYGYFGDELYYIAGTDRLDWGYVDHPPFSIALLSLWQAAFGESLVALRMLAALFGAAAVVAAGVLAGELGGRTRAQLLTAIVVALAPVNLVVHGFYSMNAIDVLVWELAFIVLARLIRSPTPALWIAFGGLLGIGLQNKYSVAWFGIGLLVALLATPHRRLLRTPGPWIAGAVAALLFAPHVLWQISLGFPSLEFMQAATTTKMVPVGPIDLFAQQALVMNPVALPIWLAGFVLLLRGDPRGPDRMFALIFVVTAAILIANGTSRPNYLALAQPPLIAAGAIGIERLGRRERWRWLPTTAIASVAIVGLTMSPLTLPVLAPETLARLSQQVGIGAPKMENRELGALDPHFADMIGWELIAAAVAEVYDGLPPDERARAIIIGRNYSETGAIELYGRARGLPVPASPHNSYWHWGPGTQDGSVVVLAGGTLERWQEHWADVRAVGSWDCGLCLPGRNHQTIFVAREPRAPIDEIWRALRRYN